MAAPNVPDLYKQYLIPMIFHGLKALAGMPKSVAVDEKTYRQAAVEPIWASLALPLRMIGRDKLRWDDFLLAARADVFQAKPDGTLALRADAGERLAALAQRLI